jgi:hypothetical protein
MCGCQSFDGKVGFAIEAGAVFGVSRNVRCENFQRIAAWEPWVLDQIDLTHPPGPEQPYDGCTPQTYRRCPTACLKRTDVLKVACCGLGSGELYLVITVVVRPGRDHQFSRWSGVAARRRVGRAK